MKKLTFGLFAMAMASMALTSCDMKTGDTTAKDSFFAYNLITPLDGGTVEQSASYYVLDMNVTQGYATVSSGLVYNKTQMVFTSDQTTVQQYDLTNYLKNFTGNVNNQSTMPLENTRLLITYNFVFPYNTFTDPDNSNNQFKLSDFYPNKEGWVSGGTKIDGVLYLPNYGAQPIVLGGYRIGQDYLVNLFSSDCTYTGQTNTSYSYQGNMQHALKKNIFYRIVLDVAKNKAYVVMLNATFSNVDREPAKPVIYLPDLDIEWGEGTYSIQATNVVPKIIEDGKLVDRPDFTFAEFSMRATGSWLESALIDFKVNNTMGDQTVEYNGSFSGSYAKLPTNFVN